MKHEEFFPLTKIVLPQKPLILEAFDRLKEGESMIVANENNPYILYYQLLLDRGDTFSWKYIEKGPEKWRVKITRQRNGQGNPDN